MKKVAIVDYGINNLLSVSKALEYCGASVEIVKDGRGILHADCLVLPGVGAFGAAMRELKSRGLIEPINAYAASGRPFLGICLGMQLMLTETEEFGPHQGLNIIPGKVIRIDQDGSFLSLRKVPHIGWNQLKVKSCDRSMAKASVGSKAFYFVHSYHVLPEDPKNILATCDHEGLEIVAMIKKENLLGCQFHPEKSSDAGLSILSSFIKCNYVD